MKQYRGLTKDGKWVYGYYIKLGSHHLIADETTDWDNAGELGVIEIEGLIEVIPETVGQATGRKLKSGEIYAGDTIKYTRYGFSSFVYKHSNWTDTKKNEKWTVTQIGKVYWNIACAQWWFESKWVEDPYPTNPAEQEPLCNLNGFVSDGGEQRECKCWDIEIIGTIHTHPELMEKAK